MIRLPPLLLALPIAWLEGCATPSPPLIEPCQVLPEGRQTASAILVTHFQRRVASTTLLLMPVNGARISSGYGMRFHPIYQAERMHRGLDLAAVEGSPVLAAGDGEVIRMGPLGAYGNYVRIRHSEPYETAYGHLSGYAEGLRLQAWVKRGQVIGYVGSTGGATGPHLHYEIIMEGKQINPLELDTCLLSLQSR